MCGYLKNKELEYEYGKSYFDEERGIVLGGDFITLKREADMYFQNVDFREKYQEALLEKFGLNI